MCRSKFSSRQGLHKNPFRASPAIRVLPLAVVCLLIFLGFVQSGSRLASAQGEVQVRITADNSYGFGYGKIDVMNNYFGGIDNESPAHIFSCDPSFGAEAYTLSDLDIDDYLYIISWSDKFVSQGVLAEFRFGQETVHTGHGDWEVYATGADYDSASLSGGPSLEVINEHIEIANRSGGPAGQSSVGWVDRIGGQFGQNDRIESSEANDDSVRRGFFPALSCISPDASWMWYNSDHLSYSNAYRGGPRPGGHHEFLIFRLGAEVLIPEPEKDPCICERVRQEAPPDIVADAIANPEKYFGWGMLLDPNKPAGPMNPLRECLNMQHPNIPFHPLFNNVVWKVGCR